VFSNLFVDCLAGLTAGGYEPANLGGIDPLVTAEIDLCADTELPAVFASEEGETSGFMRLPLAGKRLPLLHLKHGEEHGRHILRLTAAIIEMHDGGPVATAWRFESPEGEGEHDYFHCQPVREMRYGRSIPALRALPDWYFDDSPTMPLRAFSYEQLLVCLLVSIYGLATLGKMQQELLSNQLAEQLNDLFPSA
jgi:hypothetical protein